MNATPIPLQHNSKNSHTKIHAKIVDMFRDIRMWWLVRKIYQICFQKRVENRMLYGDKTENYEDVSIYLESFLKIRSEKYLFGKLNGEKSIEERIQKDREILVKAESLGYVEIFKQGSDAFIRTTCNGDSLSDWTTGLEDLFRKYPNLFRFVIFVIFSPNIPFIIQLIIHLFKP